MAEMTAWRRVGGKAVFSVLVGALFVIDGLSDRNWLAALFGLGLIAAGGWVGYSRVQGTRTEREPWPWPPEFRALAESMARRVDPTPERVVPPHEHASLVARVETTADGLMTLIGDKPAAWPLAVFASVIVQRRNAATDRLRRCVSGYQPRPGLPLSGQQYSQVALTAMTALADLSGQLDQFMLSPAFTGAFGQTGKDSAADAEAVVAVANRLMDYHEAFLSQAEACLQTPVRSEVLVFVADMGACTLSPLIGFEEFVATMCARIGEVQEVLPYADSGATVWFDDVTLTMTLPEDLSRRITAHIRHFSQ